MLFTASAPFRIAMAPLTSLARSSMLLKLAIRFSPLPSFRCKPLSLFFFTCCHRPHKRYQQRKQHAIPHAAPHAKSGISFKRSSNSDSNDRFAAHGFTTIYFLILQIKVDAKCNGDVNSTRQLSGRYWSSECTVQCKIQDQLEDNGQSDSEVSVQWIAKRLPWSGQT